MSRKHSHRLDGGCFRQVNCGLITPESLLDFCKWFEVSFTVPIFCVVDRTLELQFHILIFYILNFHELGLKWLFSR